MIAGLVLLVMAGFFGSFHLAARGKIDIGRLLGPCGFKQRYGLPCPTCGMTTSALAFARGGVLESFRIQPAAALLCCIGAAGAFFAFCTAVFGVYFCFVNRLFVEVRTIHIVLAVIVIIGAGWMVTLVRALAAR